MNFKPSFTMTSQDTFKIGLMLLVVTLAPTPASADVCVWRDPARTMSKLFPEARDYMTITRKMTPEIVSRIEKQIGTSLDESEKVEFSFYDIKAIQEGKPASAGTVLALAGKGEYGAIEIVIGINLSAEISGIYIQRSRERANKALRSDDFLNQFVGKSAEDPLEFGKDLKTLPEAPVAAEAVRLTVKKMLIFQKELGNGGEPK